MSCKQFGIKDAQLRIPFMAGALWADETLIEKVEDILYRKYSDDGDPNQRWKDMKKLIESLKGE